jgi:hypothetical protein
VQELYESVKAILDGNAPLAVLLHTSSDPLLSRVYKTSVQEHTAAEQTDIRWITFNIVSDVHEDIEQFHKIMIIDFVLHFWAREDTEEVVEDIVEMVRNLLDLKDLATVELLAWYCHWISTQKPEFDDNTLTWHGQSRYHCMVCRVADLPVP